MITMSKRRLMLYVLCAMIFTIVCVCTSSAGLHGQDGRDIHHVMRAMFYVAVYGWLFWAVILIGIPMAVRDLYHKGHKEFPVLGLCLALCLAIILYRFGHALLHLGPDDISMDTYAFAGGIITLSLGYGVFALYLFGGVRWLRAQLFAPYEPKAQAISSNQPSNDDSEDEAYHRSFTDEVLGSSQAD